MSEVTPRMRIAQLSDALRTSENLRRKLQNEILELRDENQRLRQQPRQRTDDDYARDAQRFLNIYGGGR